MPLPAVERTLEFERIEALPRRTLRKIEAEAWSDAYTPELAIPRKGGRLRPWQAMGIAEAIDNGGAILFLPVGQGKTLLYESIARLTGRRAVLIAPKAAKKKTYSDRRGYRSQWRLANPPPTIVTPTELQVETGENLLEHIHPTLFLIDEFSVLKNLDKGAPNRIDRYVRKYRDEVMVVAGSGTPGRKSILDYWHIVRWCLGDRAPLPATIEEATMWSMALDLSGPRGQVGARATPGPMGRNAKEARAWYSKRLVETPGVVCVDEDSATTKLKIRLRPSRECPTLNKHYANFAKYGKSPDGWVISDPLSKWRIDGQMGGCGMYTRLNPPPPEEWATRRRVFARFICRAIERSRRPGSGSKPLDTEAQVCRRYPDHPAVREWKDIKGEYDPDANSEAVWLTESALDTAIDWIEESDEPGIVWCGSVEFAKRLSRETGLRYFSREGQDRTGQSLYNTKTENIIVSWVACNKIFNLQEWSRMSVFLPPQSAEILEQMFGRAHRANQKRDVVVDFFCGSGGTYDLFNTAMSEAGFNKESVTLTQKILRAEITRRYPRINDRNQFRWAMLDDEGMET